ncbi:MAG: hypothetical protein V4628_13105 [Pseudomonadota bacterium]
MKMKPVLLSFCLLPALAHAELYITVVEGLGGMPEYQEQFDTQREDVVGAAHSMTDASRVAEFSSADATREKVLAHFAELTSKMTADDRAAIYLIGHGSFDGTDYKFNISGPDISAADIKDVMDKLPGKNHFLVNTSSTSGAMVEALVGEDKEAQPEKFIVVAATRNGVERNATQFGRFFVDALTSSEADLNKNNNISIQEAYDFADRGVTAYFESEGKLATEHPQLRGAGAAQFSLARLSDSQTANVSEDSLLSDLLKQRQELDAKIEDLQLRRAEFSNAEYIEQLQALVLQSAELSEKIDAEQGNQDGANVDSATGVEEASVAAEKVQITIPSAAELQRNIEAPAAQTTIQPAGGDGATRQ